MDYLKIINLNKEPFSNSPDPDFFFQADSHVDCLQKIELAVRLKKGLAVIIGDVGTGKTTICRQIIRRLGDDEKIETHLILDPGFKDSSEFLQNLAGLFVKRRPSKGTTDLQIKESIKRYLFRRGVDENKTVVLIIDEGQKLPDHCIEILRELLNYETNEYKLLQIVLFAQKELESILQSQKNFADRISMYYSLKPLNLRETRSLIRFRLEHAGDPDRGHSFLSYPALIALYLSTGGYPRKIINLCHRVVLTLIIQNRSKAGWSTIRSSARRTFYVKTRSRQNAVAAISIIIGLVLLFFLFGHGRTSISSFLSGIDSNTEISSHPDGPGDHPDEKNNNFDQANQVEPVLFEDALLDSDKHDIENSAETVPEYLHSLYIEKSAAVDINPEIDIFPPRFLGVLKIGKNETIGRIIQCIYGEFTPGKLDKIIEVNPDLGNPDRLSVGRLIRFPFIATNDNSLTDYAWVEITRMPVLEEAFDFLRDYQYRDPSVIMIPSWNKVDGLRFSIVLKTSFSERHLAQEELEKLPPWLTSRAVVLNEWEEGTVFCSNPVFQEHGGQSPTGS